MIFLNHVSKSFQNDCVLKQMDLEIPDQSCTALIGPNGIGKTTLLNIMCGCLFPDTGEVTSDTPYFQKQIFTILSGSHQLYAKNTVEENIRFLAFLKGLSRYQIKKNLERYQTLFPSYHVLRSRLFEELSTGQKQLMILLAALVTDSQYFFLDEPTVGLDLEHRQSLLNVISGIKSQKALVVTSHDPDFITAVADQFFFLKDGEIVARKNNLNTKEFLQIYESLYLERGTML